MIFWISFWILALIFLLWGYLFLYIINYKIRLYEEKLLDVFFSRTDTFPALFETTKWSINRHSDIFKQSLELRKKEFHIRWIGWNFESFIELEQEIHHEINFIFRICAKNPNLLKNRKFLYLRDIIIYKSTLISKKIALYNKIIHFYNTVIMYKNYSIIWYVLPFAKKSTL